MEEWYGEDLADVCMDRVKEAPEYRSIGADP